MIKKSFCLTGLAMLCVLSGCGAPPPTPRENPYKKEVRVGDWVKYKMVQNAGGAAKEVVATTTVKEVTGSNITVETTGVGEQSKFKVIERGSYNPYEVPGASVSVRELGKGHERLTIDGKDYECAWFEVELTPEGAASPWTYKEWVSSSVPLSGKVKSVMNGPGNAFEHTLQDSGRGK